jgi:hypothetical protein
MIQDDFVWNGNIAMDLLDRPAVIDPARSGAKPLLCG